MTKPSFRFGLVAAVAALYAGPALASLGGSGDSVASDSARMQVRQHQIALAGTASRHVLALPNGGEVREYVNGGGQVFAVRWTGPGKPDLKALLGPHFAAFQAAHPAPGARMRRQPPMVVRGDLMIITGGHPGEFWGYAWLPGAAPAGFDPTQM